MNPILEIVVFLIGFLVGSIADAFLHRRRQWLLMREVDELEHQIEDLNEQLDADPTRAALNHGQRYVIHQIETLISRLREALEARE